MSDYTSSECGGEKKIKSVEEIKVPDQHSLPNYETESEYNDIIDLYHF